MATYTELATEKERSKVDLAIIECNCGFHSGWDNTYLDQVGAIITVCPSCTVIHTIPEIDIPDTS